MAGLRDGAGVREVAAKANVSVGTVSNVLNRPEIVGAKTRRIVQEAMDELGFVPLRAAGQLRGRRSNLVGVVVPDVGNPYWASVLRGIESQLDLQQLTMLVSSSRQDERRQDNQLRTLRSQGVDGLIIAPISTSLPGGRHFANETRYGVVYLETSSQNGDSWIGADNVSGAFLSMKHLLDAGHRNITLINGPHFVAWCRERQEGARHAIKELDLVKDVNLTEVQVSDLTVDQGYLAAEEILNDRSSSAVMCVNDMLALGVLRCARELGIRIPEDLSLIGYDDADFASQLDPPLTTVRQPSYEIGEAAARMLLSQQEQQVASHRFLPELVVRSSTRQV